MAESDLSEEIKKSSRDLGALRDRLQAWAEHRLAPEAAPEVGEITNPSASGMSSETLLCDLTLTEAGARRTQPIVVRLAPDPKDEPVFPVYDFEMQYRVIELVGAHSPVPVPPLRWLETDPSHLGTSFFVMDRVEGRVPPDNPPYSLAGWVKDASPAERRTLQDGTVEVLAALHAIDVEKLDVDFLEFDLPGDTPLRRHVENQRRYYAWTRGERRFPLIEDTFAWLEDHWPADEGPTVISWGDSRIGNLMYDGFVPKAVFDWEMAGLAPRGTDVGWLIFMHQFFEEVIEKHLSQTGLPDLLQRDAVASTYERLSGHGLPDLRFYEVYGALRHGIIMARIASRMAHFGQSEWPDDPQDVIPHRGILERMLAGSYWDV